MNAFRRAPRLHAKQWAERRISRPIARLLIALHIPANAITLVGLGVAGGAAYLIAEGRLFAGGAVMLAGAALDMLDGAVARLANSAGRFGAYLDSVADRAGEAIVFFGLLAFYVRDGHHLGAYLAFAAAFAAMLVSYSRARAEGLSVPGDVGLLGRPERIVVLGVGLLLGYPLYAMGIIAALALLTSLQRLWHVRRNTRDGE